MTRTPAAPRRRLHAPHAQSVTFVELFFDLVFVYAVTQVTHLTAEHLTLDGIGRSLLLFWLIWWAWTQFTWTLNPADTNHQVVRIVRLVATGAAFLMATSTDRAFGDDVLWFVVPYLVVRVLGLGLQLRIDFETGARERGMLEWGGLSLVGLGLVLVGASVEPPARNWIWLVAIGADVFAAARGGRGAWDIAPAHFSERHGLFVIIALGESLIVAATAVSAEPRSADLVTNTTGTLVVAGLLWWTYFGWLKEGLEHGLARAGPQRIGAVARDAFSFGHFPLVCGIIAYAIAIDQIHHHPATESSEDAALALGIGLVLFVGCGALAYWRTSGRLLVPRLALLGVAVAGLALAAPHDPTWQLAVAATCLLAIVVLERNGPRHEHASDAVDGDLPLSDG